MATAGTSGVFLDSAGSSLPPGPVLEAVTAHLHREAEIGGYRAAEERSADLEACYTTLAGLLGCQPDEVALTDSATRSWLGLLDAVPFRQGDRVLVGESEYAANAVALLRLAERAGISVDVVPSDSDGQFDVTALAERLDDRVALVSVVHVPTSSGLVNPVTEITAAAHRAGALVLLDACQSVGQLPVRMDELGVDMLSGTGRKWLRGPRGTGFLAVRRAVLERLRPRLVDHAGARWVSQRRYRLRDDARVFELWESGVAERLGLLRAAQYLRGLGVDAVARAVRDRGAYLRERLAALPGVRVHDPGARRCGIVTFTVDGVAPERVRDRLWQRGVAVTVSTAASSRFDLPRRGLQAVVRASPHYFVGYGQLDSAVRRVAELTG
ncbi:aminotransferase class V-fold PLP-dependent enzyme [Haloechinothrix sp. LS1_15]|uniref:aminotransferase class V-fold PLP-dependent enzyme n=1 Tax=Haloechinothrix sp. LS1_15 TaxID=2652248 RepID=UPI00294AED9F|nr:aminotransferase class V-fold PLP-dependent enzyme [Haloechinothrix sp. LS1_15]